MYEEQDETLICHSERSEESKVATYVPGPVLEILRYTRNDKGNLIHSANQVLMG